MRMGRLFKILPNLSQKCGNWGGKKGNFGRNLAQNQIDLYMNGSLFLGKLVYVWVKFQILSGKSLPKVNLTTFTSKTN